METSSSNPILPLLAVGTQGGPALSVVGDTYRVLAGGEQTGGAFAVIEMLIPPGGGPGPHAHAAIQESFYVVAGEVVVKTQAETRTAHPGEFISIPLGGTIHDFKNETDTPAHLLCLVVPAGLDKFFEEIAKPVEWGEFQPMQPPTPEEQKQLEAIAAKYGQQVFPPETLG